MKLYMTIVTNVVELKDEKLRSDLMNIVDDTLDYVAKGIMTQIRITNMPLKREDA